MKKQMAGVLISLGLLSGCHGQTSSTPGNVSPTSIISHHHAAPLPYGVFDVQSGHGKGQWRPSTDPLAR